MTATTTAQDWYLRFLAFALWAEQSGYRDSARDARREADEWLRLWGKEMGS